MLSILRENIQGTTMLDHIGLSVNDLARSREFYRAALAPLGFGLVMEVTREQTGGNAFLGFGPPGRPLFWLGEGHNPPGRVHVAFEAQTRAKVDAFYRAALEAGGKDNGPPGLRPKYHKNYYAAFVIDPDGHNVELVCHAAE